MSDTWAVYGTPKPIQIAGDAASCIDVEALASSLLPPSLRSGVQPEKPDQGSGVYITLRTLCLLAADVFQPLELSYSLSSAWIPRDFARLSPFPLCVRLWLDDKAAHPMHV